MKKFRTVASVIIMVIAGIVGFFIGAFLNEPMAGTILFSMIAGIACIVYAIDNHEEQGKFKFVTEVFAMKEIKIELLGIAIILLGIVLRANSFFEYFLDVFGFGIVVTGCFLKDKYK